MSALPSSEEAARLLRRAQDYPCVRGMPTKKFFALEDDTHSAEGLTYIGNEADSVGELLSQLVDVCDWTYAIYRTEDCQLSAFGTIYSSAVI